MTGRGGQVTARHRTARHPWVPDLLHQDNSDPTRLILYEN